MQAVSSARRHPSKPGKHHQIANAHKTNMTPKGHAQARAHMCTQSNEYFETEQQHVDKEQKKMPLECLQYAVSEDQLTSGQHMLA